MADHPILFSAPMVRALLEGRKTQTRRIIKPRGNRPSLFNGKWADSYVLDPGNESWRKQDIRIDIGDRLWVRETWQGLSFGDYQPTTNSQCEVRYAATDALADLSTEARGYPWRPSIHMPRWASRLTLTVTDVRVERLQDISEDDALAEGIERHGRFYGLAGADWDDAELSAVAAYARLWNEINDPGAWDKNPWVVAYTFGTIKQNIDRIEQVAA